MTKANTPGPVGRQYTDYILRILVSYANQNQSHAKSSWKPLKISSRHPLLLQKSKVLRWFEFIDSSQRLQIFSPYIHSRINLHTSSDVFAIGIETLFRILPFSVRASCSAHLVSLI
jgi:hypothetical protein